MFFRSVSEVSFRHMHKTFNQAFSDYPITLQFEEIGFRERFLNRMKIDQDLSGLIIINDVVAGFVFHSILAFDGNLSAYNCGTGVIPEFRGLHLVSNIYEHLNLRLKKRRIGKVYLEVLQNNAKAIHTYQFIGFRKNRLLKSYKLEGNTPPTRAEVLIRNEKMTDLNFINENENIDFSFQDKAEWIQKSKNETIFAYKSRSQTIPSGYAIYQMNGRISRIYINETERGKGIGSALVRYIHRQLDGKPLTVMNIDESYTGIDKFLRSVGFKNELNQWEMILEIPK